MMHNVYTVRAFPRLVNLGEFQGYIDHIDFLATPVNTDPNPSWSHPYDNDGMYPEVFCHLMHPEASANVLTELRMGHPVNLPGFYTDEQLAELGFENLGLEEVHDRRGPNRITRLAS